MTRQELEATVLRLWAEGYSAKEISTNVPLTRNAVIGIVHRAKYKGADVDPKGLHKADGGWRFSKKERIDKKERRVRPEPSKPKLIEIPIAVLQKEKPAVPPKQKKGSKTKYKFGVPLVDTEHHSCRYPVGNDKTGRHLFCNAPPQGAQYWCVEHMKKLHVPVRRG